MATMKMTVGSDDPMPFSEHRRIIRRLRRKSGNSSKQLVRLGGLFKRLTTAILELLEFRETLHTLKNISKPTKEKIDHIPRFSTSLALE